MPTHSNARWQLSLRRLLFVISLVAIGLAVEVALPHLAVVLPSAIRDWVIPFGGGGVFLGAAVGALIGRKHAILYGSVLGLTLELMIRLWVPVLILLL